MRRIQAAVIAAALCAGMVLPAQAAQNPYAHLEEKSRQAVSAAIQAGTIPPDATIYDCMYGADEAGATIVVQYRDKNGNWIDVLTGEIVPRHSYTAQDSQPNASSDNQSDAAPSSQSPADLEAHAQRMLELTNRERAKAGADSVEWSDYLADAAMTRAWECASLNSQRVDGQPHTRPDGSRWFTVLGVDRSVRYAEILIQNGGPENQMERFMASDDHRAIIVKESYTEVGIGVAVSDEGNLFTVQIFSK